MNSIIQEGRFRSIARLPGCLVITFAFVMSFTLAAQDCETTVYLESQTIKAGENLTFVALAVNGGPGKQFVIERDGRVSIQASKRIELNHGFKALTGSGLIASIVPCSKDETPPTKDPTVVFPNPTDGIIHIKAAYTISGLRLSDMSGYPQLEKRDVNDLAISLDLSHLKPGFYVLEIIAEKAVTETLRIEKK
jgi:hypothetical protein